jgi:hypothetical protein
MPEFRRELRFLARVAGPGREIFLVDEDSGWEEVEQLGMRISQHGRGLKIDIEELGRG